MLQSSKDSSADLIDMRGTLRPWRPVVKPIFAAQQLSCLQCTMTGG
jgi:hypothetical protein